MMPRMALVWVWASAAVIASHIGARGAEPTLAEEAAFQAAVERVAGGVLRIEPLALTTAEGGPEAAAGRRTSRQIASSGGWSPDARPDHRPAAVRQRTSEQARSQVTASSASLCTRAVWAESVSSQARRGGAAGAAGCHRHIAVARSRRGSAGS